MPLPTPYGVIKGRVHSHSLLAERTDGRWPHYQLAILVGKDDLRGCAVNLKSRRGAEIQSLDVRNANPAFFGTLLNLPPGAHELRGPESGALDVIRHPAFQKDVLPGQQGGDWWLATGMDLVELVEYYVHSAYTVYVFGALYPSSKGVHDVHMNQGDPLPDCPRPPGHELAATAPPQTLLEKLDDVILAEPPYAGGVEASLAARLSPERAADPCEFQWRHYDDSGIWQDGAMMFEYRDENRRLTRLSVLLTKFAHQSLTTDDAGHPI